jgi:hypothetical protein
MRGRAAALRTGVRSNIQSSHGETPLSSSLVPLPGGLIKTLTLQA